MGHEPTFDCQSCGACCYNPAHNRAEGFFEYVQVMNDDVMMAPEHDDVRARLTYTNEKGEVHLLLTPHEQRCVGLAGAIGRKVKCTIYDVRPSPCRNMTPGSEKCLARRAEWGIGEPPRKYRGRR
jgi:Fe-S-cluster containining protein